MAEPQWKQIHRCVCGFEARGNIGYHTHKLSCPAAQLAKTPSRIGGDAAVEANRPPDSQNMTQEASELDGRPGGPTADDALG